MGSAPDFTKAVGRCTSKTACASLDSEVNKSEVVASSSNEDGQVSEVVEVKKEADVIKDDVQEGSSVQEIAITDTDEVIGEPEPEVSGLEDEDGGVLD